MWGQLGIRARHGTDGRVKTKQMQNAAAVAVSLLMKVGMVSIMDLSIEREAVMT